MATRRKVTQKPDAAASSETQSTRASTTNGDDQQDAAEASRADDGGRDEDDVETVDVQAELVEEDDASDTGSDAGTRAAESAALGKHDPLQIYLREVQRHALLTPDEEHSLATKYATTQDVQAAARMVTANLRLVVKIAYEYRRAYKNIMDLIQEGNIGLMQAVKKFDPNRGVKLSSYSAWWIRAYILRFIINNWRLVKLGTTQAQRKLFFNLNKEKARLSAMGIDPTPAEIAQRLGVEESEAMEMDRRLSSGEMSLDAPIGDNEGRPVSRIELLPSATMGPDALVADEQVRLMLSEKLDNFRKTLKGKDIDIFDRRLVAEEPLTLQELGDQFGISRERVRQLEARLTMNLKTYLKAEFGEAV